uniref:Secreted protein n=1 Tax=Ixodes ricinus TaxID=34613 RepID=A0A6B0UJS5_IXORI
MPIALFGYSSMVCSSCFWFVVGFDWKCGACARFSLCLGGPPLALWGGIECLQRNMKGRFFGPQCLRCPSHALLGDTRAGPILEGPHKTPEMGSSHCSRATCSLRRVVDVFL